jgi:hypothetical protein
VEAAATGQGAGVAARWPPLIVGLKIESVHELGCLSSAQAKRVVSKTQKILYCKTCKSDFISYLKMNAEFYKTCSECRHKIRLQNRRYRSTYKQLINDLK